MRRYTFLNSPSKTLTLTINNIDSFAGALIYCNHANNVVEKAVFAYFYGNPGSATIATLYIGESGRINVAIIDEGLQITHGDNNNLSVEMLCFGEVEITATNE